jgi:hypothetical protein
MSDFGRSVSIREWRIWTHEFRGCQLRGGEAKEAGGAPLHLGAFGQGERIFNIDPEVTNGAFDLCMSEEDLYSTQIACRLVR